MYKMFKNLASVWNFGVLLGGCYLQRRLVISFTFLLISAATLSMRSPFALSLNILIGFLLCKNPL